MFFSELLANSETEDSFANLRILADVAESLYEIEHPPLVSLLPKIPTKPRTPRKRIPSSETSSSALILMGTPEETVLKNPNSQSSTSMSRKRRAVEENRVNALSWNGRETPEWLLQLVRDLKGTDPVLVFEKTLTITDTNSGQGRLLMPFKSLISNGFLTATESATMSNEETKEVQVIVIDERNEKWDMKLKRWDMKKALDRGSSNYALTSGWNKMVEAKGWTAGDTISVWSFRCNEKLHFAIVPPPTE